MDRYGIGHMMMENSFLTFCPPPTPNPLLSLLI